MTTKATRFPDTKGTVECFQQTRDLVGRFDAVTHPHSTHENRTSAMHAT